MTSYGLLIKGVTETVENEEKQQKGGFLDMLATTLGASLLWKIVSGKRFKLQVSRLFQARSSLIFRQL